MDKDLLNTIINSTVTYLFVEILGRLNLEEGLLTSYGPDIALLPTTFPESHRSAIIEAFKKNDRTKY